MKEETKRLQASVDRLQAQVNALKGITQAQFTLFLLSSPNPPEDLAILKDVATRSLARFESEDGDQRGDEWMRSTMGLFAHEYFEAIEAAMKKELSRGPEDQSQ